MSTELDAYDRREEDRDATKVKHLRRIADALETIASAMAPEGVSHPDDTMPEWMNEAQTDRETLARAGRYPGANR